MTNLWFEITATAPPDQADAVAALMRDVTPGGVTVEEPLDLLGIDEGVRLREGEPYVIRAYLPSSELGAVLTDQLRTALARFPDVELVAKPFYEEDWAQSWRAFFGVVDSGGRIVVVPSWIDHEHRPGQVAIRLDPGQAFGTGHHETTRLCLGSLEGIVGPGASVLDVGAGSGILSIGAALLGAAQVTGIDIDPITVDVARANAAENGVADRVEFHAGVLDDDHDGQYDAVVSNINRNANMGLAATFSKVVKPGGMLLLSGFLAEDAPAMTRVMAGAGFVLAEARHERDWCMLGFQRR